MSPSLSWQFVVVVQDRSRLCRKIDPVGRWRQEVNEEILTKKKEISYSLVKYQLQSGKV